MLVGTMKSCAPVSAQERWDLILLDLRDVVGTGSFVYLDLQWEGGAGLGLHPPCVNGVRHVGKGDGGDRALGPEGGHVWDKISLGGGGGGLHGIEHGRVRQYSTGDIVLIWRGIGSAGG